ncbi:unnamed protein product, partial [Polarella glacialis]
LLSRAPQDPGAGSAGSRGGLGCLRAAAGALRPGAMLAGAGASRRALAAESAGLRLGRAKTEAAEVPLACLCVRCCSAWHHSYRLGLQTRGSFCDRFYRRRWSGRGDPSQR